jgi:hypothetical protein
LGCSWLAACIDGPLTSIRKPNTVKSLIPAPSCSSLSKFLGKYKRLRPQHP